MKHIQIIKNDTLLVKLEDSKYQFVRFMDDVLYLSVSICIGLGKNNLSRAGGVAYLQRSVAVARSLKTPHNSQLKVGLYFYFFASFTQQPQLAI